MTTQPAWDSVDNYTSDLLALVAEEQAPPVDREWTVFENALTILAELHHGVIRPNDLRPMVRDLVAPRRIGAFTKKALRAGLIAPSGEWQVSDDVEGHNAGRPARIYRWTA